MTDDEHAEHDEEDEFSNMFENPDEQEDPLSDIGLRRAFLKSYLQMQDGLKAMGATPRILLPQVFQALNAQEVDSGASKPEDAQPALHFSKEDLERYVAHRERGLADKSKYWIHQESEALWDSTHGEISHTSMTELREFALRKYTSVDSHSKVISFAKAFLRHLARLHVDQHYLSFTLFLDLPKVVKERHAVTSQIVTKKDIENVLAHIRKAENDGRISSRRAQQYRGFVIFGAYTGQRSLATMSKLRVGQFREALRSDTPCIEVLSSQDKIKFSHYVPLHSRVIKAIQPLLEGKSDDEPLFEYNSIVMWVKREKIPLTRVAQSFTLGSLRKWAEQHGDIIQWDSSNRAYVMSQ